LASACNEIISGQFEILLKVDGCPKIFFLKQPPDVFAFIPSPLRGEGQGGGEKSYDNGWLSVFLP
jgi:hypothetical protein